MTKTEVINKCQALRNIAMSKDKFFTEDCYEWEFGTHIVSTLIPDGRHYMSEVTQCMGIPVRVSHADPFRIKLWKEVM